MGSYGRNLEFRIVPESENRLARYATPATGTWVLGSAVAADWTAGVDGLGRQIIKQAAASTPPKKGEHGLLLYEYAEGAAVYKGVDPYLTTYSDFSTAPVSKGIQLVSGPNVKVVFRNTDASTFLVTRSYAGRIMVAGFGATPTVALGDMLEPVTTPNDTDGYWKETATAANAWLKVVGVDSDRGEVEAIFLF